MFWRFRSWSQPRIDIKLEDEDSNRVNIDDYTENSVWKLTNSNISVINTKKRLPSFIKKQNASIKEIQFSFNIQRRPLYFMINGIFPCLLLNCLTLLFFFLPYGSQVGLSMSSILTFSVYSLRV